MASILPTGTRRLGIRLHYLDGMRGIAALAVTILHAFEMFGAGLSELGVQGAMTTPTLEAVHDYVLQWGMFAVEVFIVLSGYSLMLGVARAADGRPKGGLKGYFLRRVQRIWPPYYACVAISVALIVFVPGMGVERGRYWDLALPALTTESIVTQLLFLQNLSGHTWHTINPPLWTIAVEEQIYILFPLVLLPFWRNLGTLGMIVIAMLFGVGTFALNPSFFAPASLWFIILFAFGAAAASIGFSSRPREQWLRERVPWAWVGIALLVIFVAVKAASETGILSVFSHERPWLEDVVLGAGVASLLIVFTEQWKSSEALPRFAPLRLFSAWPIVKLGLFSYSLYLMHAPLLALMTLVADLAGLTGYAAYVYILAVGVPTAVVGAYLFHRLFERPFMPKHAFEPPAPVLVAQQEPA